MMNDQEELAPAAEFICSAVIWPLGAGVPVHAAVARLKLILRSKEKNGGDQHSALSTVNSVACFVSVPGHPRDSPIGGEERFYF
jgi:hypothetical protein